MQKHLSAILAGMISIVGWVYTATTAINKANDTAHHMEEMSRNGSELAQRNVWRVESLEKEQARLEARLSSAVYDIQQIKSDVRVVVEWVEEQKRRTRNENSTLQKQGYHQQTDRVAN